MSRNVAPKPTDQSCSSSIFRLHLQLSPTHPFHFRPTLNIKDAWTLRVVHMINKKQSDKHGILQTWLIFFFFAMLLNQQKRPPRTYCYQSSEITAYRNKISLKLGYRTVNARKYVRCARTFYYGFRFYITPTF